MSPDRRRRISCAPTPTTRSVATATVMPNAIPCPGRGRSAGIRVAISDTAAAASPT
jgi:hypothetical protein